MTILNDLRKSIIILISMNALSSLLSIIYFFFNDKKYNNEIGIMLLLSSIIIIISFVYFYILKMIESEKNNINLKFKLKSISGYIILTFLIFLIISKVYSLFNYIFSLYLINFAFSTIITLIALMEYRTKYYEICLFEKKLKMKLPETVFDIYNSKIYFKNINLKFTFNTFDETVNINKNSFKTENFIKFLKQQDIEIKNFNQQNFELFKIVDY